MTLPPVPLAVTATMPELLPRVTPVIVGASGTVAATNDADGVEAAPSPIALVASTVQVYVLAFVSELTVTGEVAPLFDSVVPPSDDVQVTV